MKRRPMSTVIVAMSMCCLSLSAQEVTMRNVFKQMPDSLLPSLTQNNRLDMIDFIDSKMDADVKNKFDEHSQLTILTDKFMHLDISEASTVELRILQPSEALPDTAEAVVCMVQTFGTDGGESTINLYTSKWHKLSSVSLIAPNVVLSDTLSVDQKNELDGLANTMMTTAKLSPTDETLTLTPTFPLLSTEDKAKITPYIKPTIIKWNGKTFK